MNSDQKDLFETPQPETGSPQVTTASKEPFFVIQIPGALPSWNEILGMEYWARDKFKQQLQDAFLSALRQCAIDSSTKITPVKSIMLTAADTLASYREMVRERRRSRRSKKKLNPDLPNLSGSKSSESKVPF